MNRPYSITTDADLKRVFHRLEMVLNLPHDQTNDSVLVDFFQLLEAILHAPDTLVSQELKHKFHAERSTADAMVNLSIQLEQFKNLGKDADFGNLRAIEEKLRVCTEARRANDVKVERLVERRLELHESLQNVKDAHIKATAERKNAAVQQNERVAERNHLKQEMAKLKDQINVLTQRIGPLNVELLRTPTEKYQTAIDMWTEAKDAISGYSNHFGL